MSANISALSTVNPVIVYSALGFYGIVIFAVLLYVYQKFSGASRLLDSLRKDWESAESTHKNLLTEAKAHVSKLTPSAATTMTLAAATSGNRSVTFDTRNQVVAMGRKGFKTSDIARACALPEADVDVLLGVARIQR
jgi:hypothetical protein